MGFIIVRIYIMTIICSNQRDIPVVSRRDTKEIRLLLPGKVMRHHFKVNILRQFLIQITEKIDPSREINKRAVTTGHDNKPLAEFIKEIEVDPGTMIEPFKTGDCQHFAQIAKALLILDKQGYMPSTLFYFDFQLLDDIGFASEDRDNVFAFTSLLKFDESIDIPVIC
jgi:hypothetical protein